MLEFIGIIVLLQWFVAPILNAIKEAFEDKKEPYWWE